MHLAIYNIECSFRLCHKWRIVKGKKRKLFNSLVENKRYSEVSKIVFHF